MLRNVGVFPKASSPNTSSEGWSVEMKSFMVKRVRNGSWAFTAAWCSVVCGPRRVRGKAEGVISQTWVIADSTTMCVTHPWLPGPIPENPWCRCWVLLQALGHIRFDREGYAWSFAVVGGGWRGGRTSVRAPLWEPKAVPSQALCRS